MQVNSIYIVAGLIAFDDGEELRQVHLQEAIASIVPLARLMAEEIKALRKWAEGRTRPASPQTIISKTRKLDRDAA